jgi:flagellar protein FlaI
MATDDDAPPSGEGEGASEGEGEAAPALDGAATEPPPGDGADEGAEAPAVREPEQATDDPAAEPTAEGPRVVVGEYTWADFLAEYGAESDIETLYRGYDPRNRRDDGDSGRWDDSDAIEIPTPTRADWADVGLDPEAYLDFHPADAAAVVESAATTAAHDQAAFEAFCDPTTTPVVKGEWLWEHYKREYYYNADGSRPRRPDGEIERFDAEAALGFDPDAIEDVLAHGARRAEELDEVVDERTVDVDPEFDEDAFFTDARGATTVVNRYDLEKAVPLAKKSHFREVERYWVNEPHAFVIIFHSTKENEKKYYVIQPHQTPIEAELVEFLTGKLRTAIKYDDESVVSDAPGTRRRTIEQQALELLDRYNLYAVPEDPRAAGLSILPARSTDDGDEDGLLAGFDLDIGFGDDEDGTSPDRSERRLAKVARSLGLSPGALGGRFDGLFNGVADDDADPSLDGIAARPEPAVIAEDAAGLTDYQVEKLLYALRRDFIGYERIDGIKHDVNVEDISCDGYNSRVFVYHSDYEQIISNVSHGEEELDDFVVKLAQRSGKGISKRRPQVDATLPDGSRAQLTLGREVSDHGTNYTIRQFKDVPFTPVDLINWKTFSLEEMAFLWLCIENDKSLIFAGGTASGKTTSLNAVSLFIPSNAKIVSIEDTREVELPQRNWVASVTRPSFTDDDGGDVDEFDLLEAALRQRPDYIVMGEIRGEEGRTLFQVMSTGHTTYTTFHADSVGEVLKRFTTDPINVSKTMFTALDLVSIQTSTRVQGDKVRRNKSLTEINHYDAENDEINVQDVYQWQAEGDEFLKMGSSNTLEDIKFDRGWSNADLDEELFKRRVVLAYLIDRGLNTYTQVAATLQAFINDEETILALMARDELERSLEDLREMESVKIDVDPEKEEMVPRPTPGEEVREVCSEILERAEAELWDDYRDLEDVAVADALVDVESAPDVAATGGDHHELDALEDRTDPPALDDDSDPPALDDDSDPSALDDDSDPPALDDGTGPSADPAEADPVEDTVEPAGTADGDGDDDAVAWEAVDGEEDGDEVDLFERLDGKSTDERTTAEEFGAGGEAEDDATDAESDGEVGIEELLDAGDEGDDGGTTWDGSGFEPVDPNDDDGDGDQAASDGGVATRSGDEPDSDTDEWFDGDGDGGDASGGDR